MYTSAKEDKGQKQEFMACTEEEDRTHKKEKYKEAKWVAKKTVAEAKDRAFEAFYQKLDTKDGEKYIFKLDKVRSRQKKDLGTLKCIKYKGGRVLFKQENIKMRWH